ncbi:4-hydroxyphenylpyruvate dioxygenase [Tumebacillus permanentifrigoris]|uniref:4-hydroxyphenylpyruvate dioxygenase n=1 Tax=Tumebacillus permanentifrigoris TaxID=378543 RepID=A0A316D8F5_9BACL|nr:4-hydroxyphenylpyruvate dioxygenase [Tumebacillus permanentifrigoris]PWK10341.1 4-hydroxyphenylpyruvate dioxygenase [Tumebacillus permanentifrigoris]
MAEHIDFLPIRHVDFVEFWVGNAKQAAFYFASAFGFRPIAYKGLETGSRDRVSYYMRSGDIHVVLTGTLDDKTDVADHVRLHGDGVKDIAMRVDDAEAAYKEALKRGAVSAFEPKTITDAHGTVKLAAIYTYGETLHTFVERDDYNGIFLPGFSEFKGQLPVNETGLVACDHIVGNVEEGKMDEWVRFYSDVLGFSQLLSFDDKDISTEYTALMSKVMQNGTGRVKFPLNEPAQGKKKSQIEEFLDFYKGPGAQHMALMTHDILDTVAKLRANGVEFLSVPDSYYEELKERVGDIDEEIEKIKALNILVDRDEDGYLLQIFSKPVMDRPTFFFEIIQRKGATSFGKGNFRALFEAIEREQEVRGTL